MRKIFLVLVSGAFHGLMWLDLQLYPLGAKKLSPMPIPILVVKLPSAAVIICLLVVPPVIIMAALSNGPTTE